VQPRRAMSAPAVSTILVVDDSPVNLQVLVKTLNGEGRRVLVATGGKSAIEIAERVHPDLMLLDVMMPDMDGFEVCRALKSNPATKDIIVIFLSALGEVADKVAGLELGAVDYVTKPIQTEEVLARVANHLARQRLEREVRESRDSLDRELASAAEMQRLILPGHLPDVGCLSFTAHYQTSRYAGGDYYDVVRLPEDRCGVLIADVSGHGASSAILMAMLRAVFHAYPEPPLDPAALLRFLNDQFRFLWGSPQLATAFYAVIDGRTRQMSAACAGHNPPLILHGEEAALLTYQPTIPLLVMDLPAVPVSQYQLQEGDRILFYTDGVVERENSDGAMYEVARLKQTLSRLHQHSAEELVQEIIRDVEQFAAGHELQDDQTLLLVTS
jgi:sigma-B regulation protein RsbU (phosphoserine phosphatase)